MKSSQLRQSAVLFACALLFGRGVVAAPFDAAPFALPLPEGPGLMWEDPREIHQVIVQFQKPPTGAVRLEYWGSWWPERHLPKDREPGGGDMGWMELGNWWKYGWRVADTETRVTSNRVAFTFHPVNAKEFPKVKDYPATFRYTLKLRVTSETALPLVEEFEAFTDSEIDAHAVRLAFAKPPSPFLKIEAFNGTVKSVERVSDSVRLARLIVARNTDPNTFDRTLVTVRDGEMVCTFAISDLARGELFIPSVGLAALNTVDQRSYAEVEAGVKAAKGKTLYDRVGELPEQTWRAAWDGMPPKKSWIYFPLGLDGGRQRFRLNADGSVELRSNDHYLQARPGLETNYLAAEKAPVRVSFGLSSEPVKRTLVEESLPICVTTWERDGVRVTQTAFVTELCGLDPSRTWIPSGDRPAVFMAEFVISNSTETTRQFSLPVKYRSGGGKLTVTSNGWLSVDGRPRGHVMATVVPTNTAEGPVWTWRLNAGEWRYALVKIPYLVQPANHGLAQLGVAQERTAVAKFWRQRLDESATLITPEPMLNEFYRSHAMHLLVNCERDPKQPHRFARVGSFSYGAYGNESCMMVLDLERRGYHREAQECLDGWLAHQGTVGLPGSFAGKEGVLYGAGGYEAGGYNQHHGWILWILAEHYRFTRDQAWLRRAAPGIVKGADWIIRETARTADRHELERGLLPAGSLEDIGDWWTWLSTSCYTWRGLDAASWAMRELNDESAPRLRQAADEYHRALTNNFFKAIQRSPVVRLRDGTAVPKVPSHVHRRGRTFGWICETLEGALHLLITRAIDPRSDLAEWILKDYEDNLYLSNQYGYTLDDFERHWFSRGGMSMQACLLLGVEPYLYRDDVKHALRVLFNGQAVSYFPDVRMNTEHALPEMGDWRGDHFKSSDEANCTGWLRQLFIREESEETLLIGQAVPREWLRPGQRCGMERAASWFGPLTAVYTVTDDAISCRLDGPRRNPPKQIRVRFRHPQGKPITSATLNGKVCHSFQGEWITLPGDIGKAVVTAGF